MYEVGQKLWYVPSQGNRKDGVGEEVTIAKIGRKWITIKYGHNRYLRINIETMEADGGDYQSPGRCYNSLEEYEKITELFNRWYIFKSAVRYQCEIPNGVTAEDISMAMEILKLKGD